MFKRQSDDLYAVRKGPDWRALGQVGVVLLVYLFLMFVYAVRCYDGLPDSTALDQAQTARQLAEGKGYTSLSIRPFDLWYLQQREALPPGSINQVRQLWYPPAAPYLQSVVFRLLWPEFRPNDRGMAPAEYGAILPLGVLLNLLTAWVLWLLGRRIFNDRDAAIATLAFMVSLVPLDALGRGPALALGALLVTSSCWLATVAAESSFRPGRLPAAGLLVFGAALLAGFGFLTDYALIGLVLVVGVFLCFELQRWKWVFLLVAAVTVAVVTMPWLSANLRAGVGLLGAYPYAALRGTFLFPGQLLDQSVEPALNAYRVGAAFRAGVAMRYASFLTDGFFSMAGIFPVLFLLSLFQREPRSYPQTLKYCAFGGLVLLPLFPVIFQGALGSVPTYFFPLAVLFGTHYFCGFVDREEFFDVNLKPLFIGAFVLLAALPSAVVLVRGGLEHRYPPYHGGLQAYTADRLPANTALVTDVPWATAWYGQRSSLLTPEEPLQLQHEVMQPLVPRGAIYLTGEGGDPSGQWTLMRLNLQVPEGLDFQYGMPLPDEHGRQALILRQLDSAEE